MQNRLRELREQRKLTQLKVSLDLFLSQNSISRYENGEREAGYALLIRFADYYNVSIDYILYRTDDPTWNPANNIFKSCIDNDGNHDTIRLP